MKREYRWSGLLHPALIGLFLIGVVSLSACKQGGRGKKGGMATIYGAGASFPYPIYSRWAHKYHRLKRARVNYQSIGSGGGIAQISRKTVDFGASDAPLKKAKLDKIGLIQFPMVMGGVVPVINVQGVKTGRLKLTAKLLADIFLGLVKKWDDPAVKAVNPGLKLPPQNITVVHRADGSGTTWIFTNYLAKVSPQWKGKVGFGKAVSWPTGVGGKGNEGVSAYVQRVKGAIGYVEFAYALQNNIPHVLLKNRAGKFSAPTIASFQAAAASADWQKAPGFYMVLTDQAGEMSWPITGATFILIHKKQKRRYKAREMLRFFDWCYRHGGRMAEKLHYVPMPTSVIALVQARWRTVLKEGGKPLWP